MKIAGPARTISAAVILLALARPVPLSPQARSDLSGTWTATTEAPRGMAAAPSPVLGPMFALLLEGEALTVIRPVRDGSITAVFKLDGSRTTFKVPGRMCEGDSEFIETASWEGDAIALTGVGRVPPGGGPPSQMSVKRLLRLESPDTLMVEGTMAQAGTSRAVATVYRRSTDPISPPKTDRVRGVPATIAQLPWIPGFWIGANSNLTVEERWTPAASGSSLGLGRTLRGKLIASFEFLCIAEREGSLVYTAMPDGRTTPTHFTLTSLSSSSATFENPAHDFPKTIRYSLQPDGTLETVISGTPSQRTQRFVLKRQE